MSKPPPPSNSSRPFDWRQVFSLDLRSLAAFRIALAILILIDLFRRLPLIEAFYTDDGVLPRLLVDASVKPFSLHMAGGSSGSQLLLFGLAACSALLLLVGRWTRVATVACWVLTTSLHVRNLHLVIGADEWMRVMLLWSMFLPLGARWSLDARRAVSPQPGVLLLSAATVAMVLQFSYVYFCAGWCKSGPEWHSTHTAVQLALGQGDWVRPVGRFLSEYPALLRFLTPTVVYYEFAAAFLLLLPFLQSRVRTGVIVSLWLFQLSMGLSLHVQLFPWVSSAATLPLIPGSWWDWMSKRIAWMAERPASSPRTTGPRSWAARLQNAVVIGLLGWVTAAAFSYYARLETEGWQRLRGVGYVFGMAAMWDMYYQPAAKSSSHEAIAVLRDGSTVDLIQEGRSNSHLWPATQSRPGKLYLVELSKPHALEEEKKQYVSWLCKTWNRSQPPERWVANVKFIRVTTDILSPQPPRRDIVLEANFSKS